MTYSPNSNLKAEKPDVTIHLRLLPIHRFQDSGSLMSFGATLFLAGYPLTRCDEFFHTFIVASLPLLAKKGGP